MIPPTAVQRARERYRQSGASTDQSDAYVIADMVRTDQAQLQPWHPDTPLTRQLRANVSVWLHLTQESTRLANRLRAVLVRYYPAALHIFSTPMPPIRFQFIQAFPTPQAAAALRWDALAAFARAHHERQSEQRLRACCARLQQPSLQADPAVVAAYADEAVLLAGQLLQLTAQQTVLGQTMQRRCTQHPDAPLFQSLPGTGAFLAPALLAKFGDDRQRVPSPARLQSLAGTCPVTKQSGKRRRIEFRHACDREFRWIVQHWAMASLNTSVWAAGYWAQLQPRCHSATQAYRCLANRWLAIAWKVWQARQPYNEAAHLQRHWQRQQPRR